MHWRMVSATLAGCWSCCQCRRLGRLRPAASSRGRHPGPSAAGASRRACGRKARRRQLPHPPRPQLTASKRSRAPWHKNLRVTWGRAQHCSGTPRGSCDPLSLQRCRTLRPPPPQGHSWGCPPSSPPRRTRRACRSPLPPPGHCPAWPPPVQCCSRRQPWTQLQPRAEALTSRWPWHQSANHRRPSRPLLPPPRMSGPSRHFPLQAHACQMMAVAPLWQAWPVPASALCCPAIRRPPSPLPPPPPLC
mmetsp:Transcript_111465/g.270803  ORF Transcript_111465/g.270803 Transcript_111465/m.270803 type:complete len:247 (-) Transcript_111465:267-1007(-)